jgi:multiple sugar transport system ATP-binding protein
VAVIRKGELQQVERPQVLYDQPVNLFVAGFIGSPSMNMVEAELSRSDGSLTAEFGGIKLAIDDEVRSRRPGLKRYEGKRVVLGIRPEDMEDASGVGEAPADRRIRTTVDLREALGSEVLVHFTVQAPIVVTEDTKQLAVDAGAEALETMEARAKEDRSVFVAALNPRTEARRGQEIELVVDTSRLHFFDPQSGLGIHGDESG